MTYVSEIKRLKGLSNFVPGVPTRLYESRISQSSQTVTGRYFSFVVSNLNMMSSSFKRAKSKVIDIKGTKVSLNNNQLLVSSGVPTLDGTLGGGIIVGSVFLVGKYLK